MSTRMMSRSGMTITPEQVDIADMRSMPDITAMDMAQISNRLARLEQEKAEMAQKLQRSERECDKLRATLASVQPHPSVSGVSGTAPIGFGSSAGPSANRPRPPRTQTSGSLSRSPYASNQYSSSQYSPMTGASASYESSFHESSGHAPKKPPIVDGSSAAAGKYARRPPISSSGSRSASTTGVNGPVRRGRGPPLQYNRQDHPYRGPGYSDDMAVSTPLNSKAPEWQPPRPTLGSSARRSEERSGEFADKAIHARPHRGPPVPRSYDTERRDDLVVDAIAHGHHFSSEDHERIQDSRRHRSSAKRDTGGPSPLSGSSRRRPHPPSRASEVGSRSTEKSSGPHRDWSPFPDQARQTRYENDRPNGSRTRRGPGPGAMDRGRSFGGDTRGRGGFRGGPVRAPPMRGGISRDRSGSRGGSAPAFPRPNGAMFFDERNNSWYFRCCPPPEDRSKRMPRGDCLFCRGRTPYLVQSKNSEFTCLKQALYMESKIQDASDYVDYPQFMKGRTVVLPPLWYETRHPLKNSSLYYIAKDKFTVGFLLRNHRFIPEKRHTPKMDPDTLCRVVRVYVENAPNMQPESRSETRETSSDLSPHSDPRRDDRSSRGGGVGRGKMVRRGQGRRIRSRRTPRDGPSGVTVTEAPPKKGSSEGEQSSSSKDSSPPTMTKKKTGSQSPSKKKSSDKSSVTEESPGKEYRRKGKRGGLQRDYRKTKSGTSKKSDLSDKPSSKKKSSDGSGSDKSTKKITTKRGVTVEMAADQSQKSSIQSSNNNNSNNGGNFYARRSPPKREWKRRTPEYRKKDTSQTAGEKSSKS